MQIKLSIPWCGKMLEKVAWTNGTSLWMQLLRGKRRIQKAWVLLDLGKPHHMGSSNGFISICNMSDFAPNHWGTCNITLFNWVRLKQLNLPSAGGHYIRRWCPELANLPTQYVHAPWDDPSPALMVELFLFFVSGPWSIGRNYERHHGAHAARFW